MTDDWDTAYARQTESLREQLELIRALPNSKRHQYRLLRYICASCQRTILEVWGTRPRVVLGIGTAIPEGKYPTQEQRDAFVSSLARKPRVADWQEFYQRYVDWDRPDEIRYDPDSAKFHAIPDDLEGKYPTQEQRDAFVSSLARKPRVADWQEFYGRYEELRRNTRMHYVCMCHQWDLSEATLADDLRAKKKRRSLDPRSNGDTPEPT